MFECVHDIRVVQSSETAKYSLVQQTVAPDGDSLQLGYRADRVLLHGAGQPYRVHRQRRSLQPLAAEGYPGVPFAHRLHRLHAPFIQGPALHPQPSHRLLPADSGGVFHF